MAANPRMPKGFGYQGQKLWKSVTAAFDMDLEPHKRRILYDACKLADRIDQLEKEMRTQPLTVMGSAKQRVIHPLISEIRFSMALMAQLLARLNFEPQLDEGEE